MDSAKLRSEQLIINGVISEPSIVHDIMRNVSQDMFEDPSHKLIFSCISNAYMNQEPINLITACYVYKLIDLI